MEDFARALADFVRDHQAWASPIVLVLAFGELLAFISLLIPAWGALVAIGALIGASGISFWPVWIAGGIGAALGDWVSYWFGYRFKEHVAQMWPLSRYPGLLPRGEEFVRAGACPAFSSAVFSDRCGPRCRWLPASFEMPYWQFQIANFVSALVWSAALLLFGDVIAHIVEWLWRAYLAGTDDRESDPLNGFLTAIHLDASGRGPIATAMINAATIIIARRRRISAVWAVVCV